MTEETHRKRHVRSWGVYPLPHCPVCRTTPFAHDDEDSSNIEREMHLVIKDNSGGQGHAHKRPDHNKFFPTKIRMTLIQVSKGARYDEALVPNLSAESVTKDHQ